MKTNPCRGQVSSWKIDCRGDSQISTRCEEKYVYFVIIHKRNDCSISMLRDNQNQSPQHPEQSTAQFKQAGNEFIGLFQLELLCHTILSMAIWVTELVLSLKNPGILERFMKALKSLVYVQMEELCTYQSYPECKFSWIVSKLSRQK